MTDDAPLAAESEPVTVSGDAVDLRRPRAAGIGAWMILLAASWFVAGAWGAVAPVVVAAVVLADLPRRLIGVLGVACVAAVPVSVLVGGVPSIDDLSPAFVSQSLVPHHLMYTGLVLAGCWAVLDLVSAVRADRFAVDEVGLSDEPERARPVAVALVALVALGAVAASWAVLAS